MNLTLRQLKEQNIHVTGMSDNQLDMKYGEWLELKKTQPLKPQCKTKKTVQMVIDEQFIENNDNPFKIIEPLTWTVCTTDGIKKYEDDLSSFTEPQRYIYAITMYVSEVNNGGHESFYFNSAGIVWDDALRGFETIGAQKNVEILKESIARMGDNPSKDWNERQNRMEKLKPLFDDLDTRYYESEMEMPSLYAYIREHTKDFYFSGEITI